MKYLHTMIRIKNVDESLKFFCEGLGLKETRRMEDEKGRYTLIFLAAPNDDNAEIELTYNWDGDELGEGSRNKAIDFIKNLIAKPEMGKIYKGKVVKIMEFGAFVNFLGKQDGLVHISELADKRVAKVGDVVKEGDELSVKVVGFDRGKVKLSMKQASV